MLLLQCIAWCSSPPLPMLNPRTSSTSSSTTVLLQSNMSLWSQQTSPKASLSQVASAMNLKTNSKRIVRSNPTLSLRLTLSRNSKAPTLSLSLRPHANPNPNTNSDRPLCPTSSQPSFLGNNRTLAYTLIRTPPFLMQTFLEPFVPIRTEFICRLPFPFSGSKWPWIDLRDFAKLVAAVTCTPPLPRCILFIPFDLLLQRSPKVEP